MTVCNLPDRNRWGTVGIPIPGIEVSFAGDGEILLRGRGVMRGYYGLPDESARTLDADGWLHTGDIGACDAAGHLTITDRKKDMIKTSGGKFVAPQHVEGKLKLETPLIAQALLHGEGRRFCTALVSLSEEELLAWAQTEGIRDAFYADLVRDTRVVELIRRHVEHVNANLARYEAIRRWAILPAELKVETGELTPSLKVRRRVVEQRYRDVLEGLYAEAPQGVRAQWELRSPLARKDRWSRRRSRTQSERLDPLQTPSLTVVTAFQAAFRASTGRSRSGRQDWYDRGKLFILRRLARADSPGAFRSRGPGSPLRPRSEPSIRPPRLPERRSGARIRCD